MKDLNEISKLMSMNEMEIAYWSLWLDYFHWEDSMFTLTRLLWVTAFQTKVL